MRLPAKSHTLFFLFSMLLLIAPEAAHAQLSFFDPVPGDKSIQQFLRPLFGSLFGGGASTFEQVIGIFNAAVLTIGGIMVAYTLVAGTMQTAHDGEMLGKRWSSMWIPIRTAMGVSLVVPVNGGYCVAQMIVAWMVTQGVGLADKVWTSYTGLVSTAQGMAPRSPLPAVEDLARGLLKSHVCMASHNQTSTRAGETGNLYAANATPGGAGISFGNTAQLGAECGAVRYKFSGQVVTGNPMGDPTGIDPADIAQITTALNQAHINATNTMSGAMQSIAQGIVNGTPTSAATLGQFQSAIEAYQQSVAQVAANAVNSNSGFAHLAQAASQDGWIMAGGWFMRFVSLQDAVTSRVSQTPSTSDPSNLNSSEQTLGQHYARLNSFLAYTPGQFGLNSELATTNDQNNPNSDTAGSSRITKFIKDAISGAFTSLAKYFTATDPTRHPLMTLKDFGDNTMVASSTAIVGGIGALLLIGLLPGSSAGLTVAGNFLLLLFVPLYAFGAGIAIYLPFVPFLIFFGAALGWLLIVAEAIIAAPMWAVMHLSPNGDDLMGSAKQGYMLILGLMLRPALMIFGLICALLAVETIIRVFNYVFFPAMKASMGDSLVGLGSAIAMVGIYFGTLVSLFHKLFGLIHMVPDQIMRWIGGDSSNLGHTAQELQGKGQNQMGAAVAGLTAAGQRSGNLAGDYRNMRNNQIAAREQQRSSEMQAKQMEFGATTASRSAIAGAMDASGRAESSGSVSDQFDAMTANQSAADQLNQKADSLEQIAENRNTPKDKKAALMQEAASSRTEAQGFQKAANADYQAVLGGAAALSTVAEKSGSSRDLAQASNANATASKAAALRGDNDAAQAFKAESIRFAGLASTAPKETQEPQQEQQQDLQFPTLDGQGTGGPSDQPPPQTGRESA